jgi:hypothetical protein
MQDSTLKELVLSTLDGFFAICKLNPQTKIPNWALKGEFYSITRTSEELSILCPQKIIPDEITSVGRWRGLKIEGPFQFTEIGILNSITAPLASVKISLLSISTFDTDYVFIQDDQFEDALLILAANGHEVPSTD